MGAIKICAPYIAMVLVQLGNGGFTVLIKIALNQGLNQFVFPIYRYLFAMILLGPFAYFLERKQRPPLSIPIMIKVFILSTFGTTICVNVFYVGLQYTSPTVASVLGNVTPGFTFVMALLFRLEKVKMKTAKGKAKAYGTLLIIGGAMIFTFWKGGYQVEGFIRSPLLNTRDSVHGSTLKHHKEDWIKGSLLILISFIGWSASFILQALVSNVYPAPLSLNTMICFFASLESAILALFLVREPTLWRVEWNMELLIIVYSGTINSAIVAFLLTWSIKERGPVFAAMFCPLQLIIVYILSVFVFAESFHLGSLIGAFLIVIGLYIVLWGKSTYSGSEGKVVNNKCSLDHHQIQEIPIAIQPLSMTIPITTVKN